MANDRLINSTQGDSIISELRTMNTNLADIKSAMAGGSNPIAVEKDVNFYDFDGACRYSYTAAEFAELTALPDNPTHEGLTAQGWNWALADAKTYVASYGKLNVGQMYITSDGKTRLYIRLSEGRLKPYLGLTGNSNGTAVSIDWGDNSVEESVTLNDTTVYTPHNYAAVGNYVITITVTTGSISFGYTSNSANILRKSQTPSALYDAIYLKSLIKMQIGDNAGLQNSALKECSALKSITIPNGITSFENYMFQSCSSLTFITIPKSVTTFGNNVFSYCSALTSIAIPNGVTSFENYMFQSCSALTSITIPNSVTSFGNSALLSCSALTSITIPNSVTDIKSSGMSGCYGLGNIKFSRSTPATVSTNVFYDLPTDCIIYVPTGSLSAYTSASNYPSSSTYTYVEY